MDILCPGDWQDSYESRLANRTKDGFGYEVSSFDEAFRILRRWVEDENKSDCSWPFKVYYIYLDGKIVGHFDRNSVTVDLVEYEILDIRKDEVRVNYLYKPGVESVEIRFNA